MHLSNKRTGLSETPIQAFKKFPVRQTSVWEPLPVQSPGLQGIPIRSTVNKMHIKHFLISLADHPYSDAVKGKNTMNPNNQLFYNIFDHSATWGLNSCIHITYQSGDIDYAMTKQ